MTYTHGVDEEIQWDPEAIDYIRSRGDRYPAAEGIEPEWTQEVMTDVDPSRSNQTPSPGWAPRGSSATPRRRSG